MARILIVDDAIENLKVVLEHSLEEHELRFAKSGSEALSMLNKTSNIDLVLLDIDMPPEYADVREREGLEVLGIMKEQYPALPVIMLTVYHSTDNAVEATKKGAFHYITKPPDLIKVRDAIHHALEDRRLDPEEENTFLRSTIDTNTRLNVIASTYKEGESFGKLVGRSPEMQALYAKVDSLAKVGDMAVLLLGETGTGKGMVAREIHERSFRKRGRFVAVNCSAIPADLLESQMFGHKKGAFTGATEDHKGFFEQAKGGAIFLDEIGDLSLLLQAKLLQVLQEGFVRPVGSEEEFKIDVRVISATNKNLYDLMSRGLFRDDLYYRLNVVPINIPALRKKTQDIPLLANYLLRRYCAEYKLEASGFTEAAMAKLKSHNWPGNIRELENVVQRSFVGLETDLIDAKNIGFDELRASTASGDMLTDMLSDNIWKEIISGNIVIDDLQKFRNRHGEAVMLRILTRAMTEAHNTRAAGQLIGFIDDDDDDGKRCASLRQCISRLKKALKEAGSG